VTFKKEVQAYEIEDWVHKNASKLTQVAKKILRNAEDDSLKESERKSFEKLHSEISNMHKHLSYIRNRWRFNFNNYDYPLQSSDTIIHNKCESKISPRFSTRNSPKLSSYIRTTSPIRNK